MTLSHPIDTLFRRGEEVVDGTGGYRSQELVRTFHASRRPSPKTGYLE